MVLAPVVRGRKGEYRKDLEKFARQGYVRARVDGVLRSLEDDIPLDRRRNHTIEIVVDRLLVKPGIEKRLEASIETATKLAGGLVRDRGSQRRGAALLAETGLHGVRHQHPATGAAVLLVQQPVRRLRGVRGAGQSNGFSTPPR